MLFYWFPKLLLLSVNLQRKNSTGPINDNDIDEIPELKKKKFVD